MLPSAPTTAARRWSNASFASVSLAMRHLRTVHLRRVRHQPDGAKYRLKRYASNNARKVCLCFVLQGHLPGDDVFVLPYELAAVDQIAGYYLAARFDTQARRFSNSGIGVPSARNQFKRPSQDYR